MNLKRTVYADNSATTKISPKALDAMMPYLTEEYGNPSSIYSKGREAKKAVEEARRKVAKAIGAETNEVYFTSGGSEADNWAIKGTARRLAKKGKKHIITTVFEHHAVLHTVSSLEKEGFEITYIKVSKDGYVDPEDVKNAIRDDTAIVSVMYANNEIGSIQPISEIGAICHKRGVLFHTDAVQALGNVEIDVKKQNIDMMSMSAHKVHGPKGVGALYCRKGIILQNLIDGGAQERSKRAGTENTAGIVGFGSAIEEICENIPERAKRISQMRDKLLANILKIDRVRLNGGMENRMPGNINVSFEGVEGESLLLWLDLNGICASSGSACTSGSLDPSHVLLAIGLPAEIAHGSLRISLGDYNTMEDVDYISEKIPEIITRLRAMSPLWERIVKGENK
ncbi:MAG: cysteine desulfurase NifS [Oscillospiraceae bacterium]|nr:cysteine desulfurase NifS [Oscillospiraceae bacterium]